MVAPDVLTTALLLTFMGAAGTTVGALLVVVQPHLSFKKLGILQGIAAGLMLCISVLDLLPASIEHVGFVTANVWFFAGVAFFAIIVALVPEPSLMPAGLEEEEDEQVGADKKDDDKPQKTVTSRSRRKVLMSGLMTALGIALHNLPEGIAVFLASVKSQAVGLSLAVAIALHNIPEGVAVALPVYFATRSRWQGFMYASVSGLAEPLGVVLVSSIFGTSLSNYIVECMLAAVGGIMAFLTIHELLPLSIEHAGKSWATAALFIGMALMSVNLFILDHWIEGGHSH